MAIPIVILSYNNHKYVENMYTQVRKSFGVRNDDIWIVDDASTTQEMHRLLDVLKNQYGCNVIVNDTQRGPMALFEDETVFDSLPQHFTVTDADLQFMPSVPKSALKTFATLTDKHKIGKVGCALSLKAEGEMVEGPYRYGKTIAELEEANWEHKVDSKMGSKVPTYRAPIHTTLAVYNKKYYRLDTHERALRVSGDYACLHLPWYKKWNCNNLHKSELQDMYGPDSLAPSQPSSLIIAECSRDTAQRETNNPLYDSNKGTEKDAPKSVNKDAKKSVSKEKESKAPEEKKSVSKNEKSVFLHDQCAEYISDDGIGVYIHIGHNRYREFNKRGWRSSFSRDCGPDHDPHERAYETVIIDFESAKGLLTTSSNVTRLFDMWWTQLTAWGRIYTFNIPGPTQTKCQKEWCDPRALLFVELDEENVVHRLEYDEHVAPDLFKPDQIVKVLGEDFENVEMDEKTGRAKQRKPVAVLTMVRQEYRYLPIWLKYYGEQVGERDMFVLHHNVDDDDTCMDLVPDTVNTYKYNCPHWCSTRWNLLVFRYYMFLLKFYDVVFFTDVDEIIVPNTAKYPGGLREYLAEFRNNRKLLNVRCTGIDMVQQLESNRLCKKEADVERETAAFDESKTMLAQRHFGQYVPQYYNKPMITKQPFQFMIGFHGIRNDWNGESLKDKSRVDPNLILLHLHRHDWEFYEERHVARARYEFSKLEKSNGYCYHYREADRAKLKEQFVEEVGKTIRLPQWLIDSNVV